MFKKISTVILCSIILLSLVACNLSNIEDKNKEETDMNIQEQKLNKMWELWTEDKAASPYAELMTYQSEINNGGHDQYFFNVENTGDLKKEMSALEQILPEVHKENLKKAYKAYLALEENEDDAEAMDVLEQCDNMFYENEGDINCILAEYASKIEL